MKRDPGLYDYLPYKGRPKIEWPGGARVAFWVAPNIEFYELAPPKQPAAYGVGAAGARRAQLLAPRLRQPRRLPAHAGRDGPLRRARQRLAQRRGVRPPSRDHRGVREARLGVLLPRHLQHALRLRHDRGPGARAHPRLDRDHPQAYGPEARRLARAGPDQHRATLDLLAEDGAHYTCDLFHDDQPTPVNMRPGRLAQHPLLARDERRHRLQLNLVRRATTATIIRRQFDRLYARRRGVRHGDVHSAPSLPRRPAAPDQALRGGAALHHRAREGVARHRARDRPAFHRALLRRFRGRGAAGRRGAGGRSGQRPMAVPDDYLQYPRRRYGMDHDRYGWSILPDRARKVAWPGGARMALWVIPIAAMVSARHEGAAVPGAGRLLTCPTPTCGTTRCATTATGSASSAS